MSGAWRPGDIVRDDNNDLYWRSWDNADWVFCLRRPGNWRHRSATDEEPMLPLTLVVRDQRGVSEAAS